MSKIFVKRTSWVFSKQFKNYSRMNFEECIPDVSFDIKQQSSCNKTLKSIPNDNVNKLIFSHLNINSIRNMVELLKNQIKDNIDMRMVSETKTDDTFPHSIFLIEGLITKRSRLRDRFLKKRV